MIESPRPGSVTTVGAASLGGLGRGGVSRAAAVRRHAPAAARHRRGAAAGRPGRLDGFGPVAAGGGRTVLEQTHCASANRAEVALRFQFKRRGWPLRTRAQALSGCRARKRGDLARAASAALGGDARLRGEALTPACWCSPRTAGVRTRLALATRLLEAIGRRRSGPASEGIGRDQPSNQCGCFSGCARLFLCPRAIRLYDYVAIQEAARCRGPETP
jgi:hypothetical protein